MKIKGQGEKTKSRMLTNVLNIIKRRKLMDYVVDANMIREEDKNTDKKGKVKSLKRQIDSRSNWKISRNRYKNTLINIKE